MIEPKIVIFFNLLIAASDYNFGAPVTEWPSRCLADKRNFKKNNNNNKQTKQNKNTQPQLVDTWARDTVMRYW